MRLLYFYIVLLIIFQIKLFSQSYIETPLTPAKERVPGYIGFLIGFGQNYQTGDFLVDCLDCTFEDGVRGGFSLGIAYDRLALPWLKYGIAGLYDYQGINSSFRETEIIRLELENSGLRENVPVQFRHTANLDIHNLTVMPYIKLEPASFFFFRLGFGASYIFSSSLKHDKELLTKEATLSNGATVNVKLENGDNKVNVQNSEIRELNNLQFLIMPALGFKINFSETTYLMPYFQYNLPLSNVSENGNDFRIHQWRLFLELGFKLH